MLTDSVTVFLWRSDHRVHGHRTLHDIYAKVPRYLPTSSATQVHLAIMVFSVSSRLCLYEYRYLPRRPEYDPLPNGIPDDLLPRLVHPRGQHRLSDLPPLQHLDTTQAASQTQCIERNATFPP